MVSCLCTESEVRVNRPQLLLSYTDGDTVSAIVRALHTNLLKVKRAINKVLQWRALRVLNAPLYAGRPQKVSDSDEACPFGCLWSIRSLKSWATPNSYGLRHCWPSISGATARLQDSPHLAHLIEIELLNGQVLGRVERRHRSCKLISWLKVVDAHYSNSIKTQIVLDNHLVHIVKGTRSCLATAPNRFEFIFNPKHGS